MTTSTDQGLAMPPGFEALTADEKAQVFWNDLILKTEYPAVERPDLVMTGARQMASVALFPSRLVRTFRRTDDMMEPTRPKIIHTAGAVAAIIFEPTEASRFTGVLARPPRGGAKGILRLSLAIPPKAKKAITPGIGLKLFVDGKPSLDLLAMNHTVGQGRDFNLFANTFTHDLRDEHEELRPPQRAMQFFFKRVAKNPRHLTINHLAEVSQSGSAVAEPVVPKRLVFRPHADVRHLFRNRQYDDFRDVLATIPVGSTLYNVDAVGEGDEGTDLCIGTITTDSRFVSSAAGDRTFFRHMTPADNLTVG